MRRLPLPHAQDRTARLERITDSSKPRLLRSSVLRARRRYNYANATRLDRAPGVNLSVVGFRTPSSVLAWGGKGGEGCQHEVLRIFTIVLHRSRFSLLVVTRVEAFPAISFVLVYPDFRAGSKWTTRQLVLRAVECC
jgi:hypothetical protein